MKMEHRKCTAKKKNYTSDAKPHIILFKRGKLKKDANGRQDLFSFCTKNT